MTQEFVPYTEALELKELGFDEPCFAFYDGKGNTQIYFNLKRDASGDYKPFTTSDRLTWFGAPTYSQTFRWFRENYTLFSSVNVDQTMEPKFCYSISRYEPEQFLDGWDIVVFNSDLYLTHEEAELECLKKLIQIVKENK